MSRRSGKTYGVASGHADEDALPTKTQTSFFQKGREFESVYVNHKYTEEEKETLATYESVDYLPPHSLVYKVKTTTRLRYSNLIYIYSGTARVLTIFPVSMMS